jgi:hypothetical protein
MRRLIWLAPLIVSGCIVVDNSQNPPPQNPPPQVSYTPGPASPLGQQQLLGYHVLANGSATMPGGELGFLVTANGQGGYRVTWTDTNSGSESFSADLTTDGTFDLKQLQRYNGAEHVNVVSASHLQIDSVPGSAVHGVDLVSSTDPIYLDLRIDGDRSPSIYYPDATTNAQALSGYDPVAFTSP